MTICAVAAADTAEAADVQPANAAVAIASNGTEVTVSVGPGGQLIIKEVGTITLVNVPGGAS